MRVHLNTASQQNPTPPPFQLSYRHSFCTSTLFHSIRYVVEGANLFITDSARDIIQDAGVILFKDASTNKGGVTCSSLEVSRGVGGEGARYMTLKMSAVTA